MIVRPIKDYPGIAEHIDGVLIVKVEEGLYFANTGQLKDRLHRLEVFGDMSVHPSEEARLNPVSHVIFDVENMPTLDARYDHADLFLFVCALPPSPVPSFF